MNTDEELDLTSFDLLPTGKYNISFSELNTWDSCSWQYKLKYIDKIEMPRVAPLADFGKAVHLSHESFLKTGIIDPKISEENIRSIWKSEGHKEVDDFVTSSDDILAEVKAAYDIHFPDWKSIDAEQKIFQPIENYVKKKHVFKGYIDAIIEAPGPRKKQLTWIIDVKTCFWGWPAEKKRDPRVLRQLIYYKHFFHKKNPHLDFKNIRCAFLLLKRKAKKNSHCEFVPISVGEKPIQKHLQVMNTMLHCVNRGIFFKNRYSCDYCDYRDTEHCK